MGKIPTFEVMDNCIKVREAIRTFARDMNLDLYFKQGGRRDEVCAVFIRNDQYYNIICNLNEVTDINKAIDSLREYMETFSGRDLSGSFIVENKYKSSIYPGMMNMYDMDICSLYPTDKVVKYREKLSGDFDGDCFAVIPVKNDYFKIEKVIFNDPATIVIWADGSKTIVKCQEGDTFDKEKGLAMAISKRALGDKGKYCDEFKKWIPEIEKTEKVLNPYSNAVSALKNLEKALKPFQ